MNLPQTHDIRVQVRAKSEAAHGVAALELTAEDNSALPDWTPGAHIDLVLPSGTIRQYSLCGDPEDRSAYTIAVLRDDKGRGGSKEVHDFLHVGDTLTIRGPRNHFPLGEHEAYLFIAGGIGITPILAMVRQVAAAGKPWSLVYGGRSRNTMAYLEAISSLTGGTADIIPADTHGIPDLKAALQRAGDVHVYTCGPEPMLRAVEELTLSTLGAEFLHLERFGADPTAVVDHTGDAAFEVELAASGRTLPVGPDERLIDVVRKVLPNVPFSCEEGFCGSCETGVLAGIPLHRDQILTPEERAANDTMMICVGRSKSPKLTLDV